MNRLLYHIVPFSKAFLKHEKTLWLKVKGKSMMPFLYPGDKILIQPRPINFLKTGNLITFLDGTALCTHRLIGKVKRAGQVYLITKGDLCARLDPPIPLGVIIGKVIAIQKGKRILSIEGPLWQAFNPILAFLSRFTGGLLRLKWRLSCLTAFRSNPLTLHIR